MRLWLLSHIEDSPSNRLFLETASKSGHRIRQIHPLEVSIALSGSQAGRPVYTDQDGILEEPEAVFTRAGSSSPAATLDLVRSVERSGIHCINRSHALEVTRDKFRTYDLLTTAGIPIPRTIVAGDGGSMAQQIDALGSPPWVIKLPVSSKGMGVSVVDSVGSLRSVADVLLGLGERVLVQEYIREAKASDVRVLVLDGNAVSAMRRRAARGEFRSNLHRGGKPEKVMMTKEIASLAERAASVLEVDVAGVDILEASDGPVVIEVNASPGLATPSEVTGLDLCALVLDFLHEGLPGSP